MVNLYLEDTYSKVLLGVGFYFIAIVLFLLTLITTKISNLDYASDFLGLVNKLPICFWASIVFVYAGLIVAYSTKKVSLFLIGVIILVFILFMTPASLEPYGDHPVSYGVTGISAKIVEGVYPLDIVPWLSMPYLAYKGFPILIYSLANIPNISVINLIRFFPVFSVISIVLLLFLFYRKIDGNLEVIFLSLMIFVPLLYWHIFCTPQLLSYILIITFLVIYAKQEQKKSSQNLVTLLILSFSIIITHILGSLFIIVLLAMKHLVTLHKSKRCDFVTFFIFVVLFLSWMMYPAFFFFDESIPYLYTSYQDFADLFFKLTLGQIGTHVSLQKMIVRYSTVLPLGFCVIVSFSIIVALFIKRRHTLYLLPICSFFAASLLLLIPYGGDINLTRTGDFILIGSSFFTALFFRYFFIQEHKYLKILPFVIILFFIFNHPIAYRGSSAMTLIPPSEIYGCSFFVKTSSRESSYFSQSGLAIVNYLDPYRAYISGAKVFSLWYPPLNEFDITQNFQYVLHGLRDHNGLLLYLEYDPVLEKLANTDKTFNNVYDNGYFWIYQRAMNP